LFDKGEARAYNLPDWCRGVALYPITEQAGNDTRKFECLPYDRVLDQMMANNPLIYRAYLAHTVRLLQERPDAQAAYRRILSRLTPIEIPPVSTGPILGAHPGKAGMP